MKMRIKRRVFNETVGGPIEDTFYDAPILEQRCHTRSLL